MPTLHQLALKKHIRLRKKHKCNTPSLRHCPHKRGMITSIVVIRPKKPNSAKRHIAKMLLLSTNKKARARIPGESKGKQKAVKQYSKVLISGGRARDIIGIRYKIILGKYDAKPFYKRKTSRSKYGVKKPIVFR